VEDVLDAMQYHSQMYGFGSNYELARLLAQTHIDLYSFLDLDIGVVSEDRWQEVVPSFIRAVFRGSSTVTAV
jgi:hypothetical protein